MDPKQKLTKQQKKGLAYRQRIRKPKDRGIPISENQDHLQTVQRSLPNDTDEQPHPSTSTSAIIKPESKKRKRTDDVETPKQPRKRSKPKETTNQAESSKSSSQRFILFVGNLKYTTTEETISQHFSKCDPPPEVRLLTHKLTKKSKGCAFLEFTHRNALQQGLKFHHSDLEGRRINVELTAGGGGKSETRLNKVKKRNRELASQRTKRLQKLKPTKGDHGEGGMNTRTDELADMSQPQRHSSTSGVEHVPLKKRTWSVPDGNEDEGKSHRGGRKHRRSEAKKRPKPLGTGVNAIPVG